MKKKLPPWCTAALLFLLAFPAVAQSSPEALINTEGLPTFSVLSTQDYNLMAAVLPEPWYLIANTASAEKVPSRLYPAHFFQFPKGTQDTKNEAPRSFSVIGSRLYVTADNQGSVLVYDIATDGTLSPMGTALLFDSSKTPGFNAVTVLWHSGSSVSFLTTFTNKYSAQMVSLSSLPDAGAIPAQATTSSPELTGFRQLIDQYCTVDEAPDLQCIRSVVFLSSYYRNDWTKITAAIISLDKKGLWNTKTPEGGLLANSFVGHWLLVGNRNYAVLESAKIIDGDVITIFDLDKMDRTITLADAFSPESAGQFLKAPEMTFWPSTGVRLTSSVYLLSGWRFLQVLPNGKMGVFEQGNGGVNLVPPAWGRTADGSRVFSALAEDAHIFDQRAAKVIADFEYHPSVLLDNLARNKNIESLREIYSQFSDPYHFRETTFSDVKRIVVQSNDLEYLKQVYDAVFGDIAAHMPDNINTVEAFYNPLIDTILQGNLPMLEYFLQKAPILANLPFVTHAYNSEGADNLPTVILAADKDNLEACRLLVAAGADQNATTFEYRGGARYPTRLGLIRNALSYAHSDAMKSYLKSIGTSEQARFREPIEAFVNDSGVRFRAGSSLTSATLRSFTKGEKIQLLGNRVLLDTVNSKQGYWYLVSDKTGAEGWIWQEFITLPPVPDQ